MIPSGASDDRRVLSWDIRSGPRNFLLLCGAHALNMLLSFSALWLTTRALGAAGYGRVAAVLAAAQLVQQALAQWTGVALLRFGCEEFVQQGRLTVAFWTRLALTVPGLALGLALAPLWLPRLAGWLHISPSLRPLVILYALTLVGWLHVQYALQAAKLPRLLAGLLTTERATVVVALSVLGARDKIDAQSVLMVYVVAPVLAGSLGLWRLRDGGVGAPCCDWRLLMRMLRFSLPLLPGALVAYLATNYLDAFFLVRYRSLADLGRFTVAAQCAGVFMQFAVISGSLLLPLFVTATAQQEEEAARRYFSGVLPSLSLVWGVSCALCAYGGGLLLPWILGNEFAPSGELLWVLMAGAALSGPWLLGYAARASAIEATPLLAVVAIVAAAVNVALDIVLIPHFGLPGCAWASCLACGLAALAGMVSMQIRDSFTRSPSFLSALPVLVGGIAHSRGVASWVALAITLALATLLGVWLRAEMRELMTRMREALTPRLLGQRDTIAGPIPL